MNKPLDEKEVWEIFAEVNGCKKNKEDCSFKRCHTWANCDLLIKKLCSHFSKPIVFTGICSRHQTPDLKCGICNPCGNCEKIEHITKP